MGNHVYVCIATRQNTINALPFYQEKDFIKNLNSIYYILTNEAKEKKWGRNLHLFLQKKADEVSNVKGITSPKIENLAITDFYKMIECLKKLFDEISKDASAKIYINIGGGTKSMILQIYQLYAELKKDNLFLLYPNIETGYMEEFNQKNPQIPQFEKLNCKIEIEKILNCYGICLEMDKHKSPKGTVDDHLSDAIFRKEFYDLAEADHVLANYVEDPKDQEIILKEVGRRFSIKSNELKNEFTKAIGSSVPANIYSILDKDNFIKLLTFGSNGQNEKNEFNRRFMTKTTERGVGKYFEILMQQKISDYCNGEFDIAYNVSIVSDTKLKKEDMEIDVVINQGNGQLLMIECKTVEMGKKAMLASHRNIDLYSGVYGKMVLLFPYFFGDFEIAEKDEKNNVIHPYMKRLCNLPKLFNESKTDFIIYDGHNYAKDYWIKPFNGFYKKLDTLPFGKDKSDMVDEGYIHMRNIHYYLNKELKSK